MIETERRTTLTAKERAELDWEKEAAKMQISYAETIKKLDLEVRKIEARWTQLFRLPLALITLPVKFIMAFAIPISVISKKELPDKFWEFMK